MDPRLQEMLDHHEIRKLLAQYAHGCDRADAQRMGSVYCADSWDDHGPNKCDGHDFAELITRDLWDTASMCSHLLGQSLITIDGDKAGAETYFVATVKGRPDDKEPCTHQLGGRYIDTLEREDGAWKIKRRICVRDWSASQPLVADWLAGAGFAEGRLGAGDPAYAALSLAHSGEPRG
jgi:ketosteroid isomerase-like protein